MTSERSHQLYIKILPTLCFRIAYDLDQRSMNIYIEKNAAVADDGRNVQRRYSWRVLERGHLPRWQERMVSYAIIIVFFMNKRQTANGHPSPV